MFLWREFFLPFYFLFLEHYFYFVFGKCTYYKTIRERYLFMRNISKSFTRQRVRRWRDQLHPRSRWAVRKGYVQGVGEARILDGTSLLYTRDDMKSPKSARNCKRADAMNRLTLLKKEKGTNNNGETRTRLCGTQSTLHRAAKSYQPKKRYLPGELKVKAQIIRYGKTPYLRLGKYLKSTIRQPI